MLTVTSGISFYLRWLYPGSTVLGFKGLIEERYSVRELQVQSPLTQPGMCYMTNTVLANFKVDDKSNINIHVL